VTAIEYAFLAAFIALAAMGMLGGITEEIVASLSPGAETSSGMP
jgi:Flp pilus assembly pilin Flp